MHKKILSLLLLAAMLNSTLSMAVFASEDPVYILPDQSELLTATNIPVLAAETESVLRVGDADTETTDNIAETQEEITAIPDTKDLLGIAEENVILDSSAPESVPVITFSHTNPLHEFEADVYIEQHAAALTSAENDAPNETPTYATSVEEAAIVVREAMKARETSFTLYWQRDDLLTSSSQIREVFTAALSHTGVPTEGDYLRWSYIRFDTNAYGEIIDGVYYYTLPCVVSYYTTADQEAAVTEEVGNVLDTIGLPKSSDYETLLAIYDFICDTVTYDNEHLEDDSYTLKYSAYAALINKTAVCQGYAALFYRLALESGIDCRMIAGRGNNTNHGWVIAKLGTLYYNLDPTWDAGESEYSYFLRGATDFGDHTAFDEYTTTSYTTTYPLSDTMYVFSLMGDVDKSGVIDMQDVVRLVRFIAGWTVEIDSYASDANEDSAMDLRDCIILLRYLAEWTDGVYRVGVRI